MIRILWGVIGAGAVVLAALPIAAWTGSSDLGPDFAIHVRAWLLGTLVVIAGAVIGGRLASRIRLRGPKWVYANGALIACGLAMTFVAVAAFIAWWAFAANPHSVDEMAQLFQARVFLAGRLAAPPPDPPEAFLFLHTWIAPAGWVSQFPPAHSLLLAVGMGIGLEWLINPILGGVSLVLVYLLARGLYGRRTALLAAVLWATSAWTLTMSATYMNHAAAVVFALGAWTLALALRRPRWHHFLLAGSLLGAVGATRPLDAVAAALPIGVWILVRRRWRAGGWVGLGGLVVVMLFALFNWRVFGHPLELGYLALYGQEQRMGFHTDVWGLDFTPLVALGHLAAAVRRLHIYLFEWPIPALLPIAIWALFAKHRRMADLLVATGILAIPALYFFYWHSGFYPGPRFYYTIAPFLIVGTARAFVWGCRQLRRRSTPHVRWEAALSVGALIVVVWGTVSLFPARLRAYRVGFLPVLKQHPERTLAKRGVEEALVLVPESWGARIVVNLWVLGVRPGLAERAYRQLDACELHSFAAQIRREGEEAYAEMRLARLMDSATGPVKRVQGWPDPTLRLRSPVSLTAECEREMQRDLRGFALYGSLAWRNPVGLDRGIVFAREPGDRLVDLLARYQNWEVWRYSPPPGDPDAPPILTPLTSPTDIHDGT